MMKEIDWVGRTRKLADLYRDYNLILNYLAKHSDYVHCPECNAKVSTQCLLTLEEYKEIFPNLSRQAVWKKLNRMHEFGWFDKIDLRRETFRVKKYWHPKIKERIKRIIKKRR